MNYQTFLNLPTIKKYSSNKQYYGSQKHKTEYLKVLFNQFKYNKVDTDLKVKSYFKAIGVTF